jgi:hypothetical protein
VRDVVPLDDRQPGGGAVEAGRGAATGELCRAGREVVIGRIDRSAVGSEHDRVPGADGRLKDDGDDVVRSGLRQSRRRRITRPQAQLERFARRGERAVGGTFRRIESLHRARDQVADGCNGTRCGEQPDRMHR